MTAPTGAIVTPARPAGNGSAGAGSLGAGSVGSGSVGSGSVGVEYVGFGAGAGAGAGAARTGPLTWGQRSIWTAMRATGSDDAYFNFGRIVATPQRSGPVPVSGAARAVAGVMERHESLRTRLLAAVDDPTQRVEATGVLPVTVIEAAPWQDAEAARRLHDHLVSLRFDYTADWPLRAGLVVCAGNVTRIVLVFCHLAADGHGADVVARDLRLLLLRGSAGGGTPPQPLDLAAHQQSPAGRRSGQASLAFWEREYRRIPPTMFGRPSNAGEQPPFWRAQLTSRAVDGATRRVAARVGVSQSTVLLSAAAALVGAVTGHRTCAMLPVVGNRFRSATRDLVSPLAQDGLFVLGLDHPGFDDLVRAGWQAAMRAYRQAEFDPAALAEIAAQVSAERGARIHPYCCFNDQRPADPASAREAPPDLAEVRAALPDTTLTWPIRQEHLNCRFCLHITGEVVAGSPALGVALTADTRYLPARDIERYLRAFEALLVRAADRDVPLAGLPALLRLAEPPGHRLAEPPGHPLAEPAGADRSAAGEG